MKIKFFFQFKVWNLSLTVLFTMAVAIMLVTGCHEDVVVMPATQEATWIANDYSKEGPCDVFTVDRTGTAPNVIPTEDMPVVVGWTNFVLPGEDPFPCNRRWHHEYQGLVKFDFQADAAIRSLLESNRVQRADLVLHQQSIPGHSISLGRTPVRSFHLTLPRNSWSAGTRIAMSDRDPSIILPPLPWPLEGNLRFDPVSDGPDIRLSLTHTVQSWIDGSLPNNGIAITITVQDLNEAGWTDNEEFLHAYYAELELTFEPR